MKLFEKYGLNPDWLKKETGPVYLRTDQDYQPTDIPTAGHLLESPARYGDPDAKSVVVTLYSMHYDDADAEPGQKGIGKLSIPLSLSGPSIQVVKVETGSMEPLINKGAYVGIDTAQKNVVSGEVYAIYAPFEGLSLKRVFLDAENQRLIMRSENPSHPEQYAPLDKRAERIMGRVIWVIQRL